MTKGIAVAVGLLLAALLLLFMSTYTVRFHEVAVKTRYGRTSARNIETDPGLHFRFPIADHVVKLDTRLRIVETPHVSAPTADQQQVVVQPFLMWRVDTENALRFAESFDSVEAADERLPDHLRTAVIAALGRYGFDDLIGPRSRLPEAEAEIRKQLAFLEESLGVEPLVVGLSQVLLPAKATTAVLARMEAVQTFLAEGERARGESEASAIRGEANTVADKLEAFAQQQAAEIRAETDEQVRAYLAELRQDERLAIFLHSLETLRQSLRQYVTIFLTDRNSPMHLMNVGRLFEARDIPEPPTGVAGSPPPRETAGP